MAIKLFINTIKAIRVDNIIRATLVIPIVFPLSSVLIKGFTRPPNIKKVNKTTMCATTLFSLFNPGFNIRIMIPKITGIKAVGE